MTKDHGRFPFGEPIRDIVQTDTSPKPVFVLGVYSSAVHAKWVGPDGKQKIAALAVANEPYIFWRGDGVEAVISRVHVPTAAGKLEPANAALNGPSGIALDDLFLNPLGFERREAWLCDLVPHSCANPAQLRAIEREYVPIFKKLRLLEATAPPVPRELASRSRVAEILDELERSRAETLVLLGDEPIRWFLRHFSDAHKNLRSFGVASNEYGTPHSILIGSRLRQVIPLVHPRQAAALGSASKEWTEIHRRWSTARHPKRS